MTPENNITEETTETTVAAVTPAAETPSETPAPIAERGEKNFSKDRRNERGGRGERRDRGDKRDKPKKEFDELLLEVRRVTRVTTGGRRMSFRATILIGNKKGKIGLGISKGNDVAGAVSKATNEAYKAMFEVPITKGDTVPYALTYKYKASRVRLLPASEGTGLKAGSSIRSVLELAGYANILSKMIGSNNKLNNALATIQALASYKHADYFAGLREVKEENVEGNSREWKKEEKADQSTKISSKDTSNKDASSRDTVSKRPVTKEERPIEKKSGHKEEKPVKKGSEETSIPTKKTTKKEA